MVIPIRKVIRNQKLLSLLESQYSPRAELGVELFERSSCELIDNAVVEKYRIWSRRNNEDWGPDTFIVERLRKHGKIREYRLIGGVYFHQ